MRWVIILASSILLGVMLFFLVSHSTGGIHGQIILSDSEKNETNETVVVQARDDISIIEEAAFNVSESCDYKRGSCDCTDYSREAVRQLEELGYNATCVFGIYYNKYFIENDTYNDAYAHTWVRVYDINNKTIHIESIGGYIIPEEEYKADFLERVLGKCI